MLTNSCSIGIHARLGFPRTDPAEPITAGEAEVLFKLVRQYNDRRVRSTLWRNVMETCVLLQSHTSPNAVPSFEFISNLDLTDTPIPAYAADPSTAFLVQSSPSLPSDTSSSDSSSRAS